MNSFDYKGDINYKLLENTDSVFDTNVTSWYKSFGISDNTKIVNATVNVILLTKRFDEPLFSRNSVYLLFASATEFIFLFFV